jgi:simple sugar transport system ATP-binding protein
MTMSLPTPVVQLTGVSVTFPGIKALDRVNFRLFPGEVHSLLGENGAGKSTLIKALTGALTVDAGTIEVDGQAVTFGSPARAQEAGIHAVYQELSLLPNLSVTENVMLGREPRTRLGGIDWKVAHAKTRELLLSIALDIDPSSPVADHPPAIRQLIAIARAIYVESKVLVLDEPTSSLDNDEVSELFRIITRLRDSGVAILFISHFLEQVYEISDRLTVLRDGRLVGEYLPHDLLRIDLVQKMLGKQFDELTDAGALAHADTDVDEEGAEHPVVQVIALGRQGGIEPVDFRVYEGEIVGIAGLLGSGRTELARLLSGIDRPDSGRLLIKGKPHSFRGPWAALKQRIAYASEDRRTEGILGELTVRENIAIALQADIGWLRKLSGARQDELAASYIQALNIRPDNPNALMSTLSGGNQQKVLLARWLALAPRLLVLDEPTRGIDLGAKAEILRLVRNLAESGMSVVFISAELEEVVRISNRIAVMRDRRKVADLANYDLTVDSLLAVIANSSNETDALR